MMYWYGNGMSGWGFALLTVSQILFWGLVIAGVIALVRYLARRSRDSAAAGPAPEQLLAERFARGEISEDEYRRDLAVLHEHHRSDSSS